MKDKERLEIPEEEDTTEEEQITEVVPQEEKQINYCNRCGQHINHVCPSKTG